MRTVETRIHDGQGLISIITDYPAGNQRPGEKYHLEKVLTTVLKIATFCSLCCVSRRLDRFQRSLRMRVTDIIREPVRGSGKNGKNGCGENVNVTCAYGLLTLYPGRALQRLPKLDPIFSCPQTRGLVLVGAQSF